jgi:hypothetical protein
MVNPNLITTIFTIPEFLSLKFVKMVEISVNFDHLTMTIWKIRRFYGHGNGRTPHPPIRAIRTGHVEPRLFQNENLNLNFHQYQRLDGDWSTKIANIVHWNNKALQNFTTLQFIPKKWHTKTYHTELFLYINVKSRTT